MNSQKQFVTFQVAEDLFAAPIQNVSQILERQPISKVPNAAPEMLGMIDVRGMTLPTIDLRTLLKMETVEDSEETRILIMSSFQDDVEVFVGLKTDKVCDVTSLEIEDETSSEASKAGWKSVTISSVGRLNDRFVNILNVDHLFQEK